MSQKPKISWIFIVFFGAIALSIFLYLMFQFGASLGNKTNTDPELLSDDSPIVRAEIPVLDQAELDSFNCQRSTPASPECTNLYVSKMKIDTASFEGCLQNSDFTEQISDAEKSYQENNVFSSPSVFIAKKNGGKLEGFELPESTAVEELKTILNYLTQNTVTQTRDLWISSIINKIESEKKQVLSSSESEFSQNSTQQELLTAEMTELSNLLKQGSAIKSISIQGGITQGNSDNYLIVYLDFSCTSCKDYFQEVISMIEATYLKNNQITLVTLGVFNETNRSEMIELDKKLRCANEQSQVFDFQNYYFSVLQ